MINYLKKIAEAILINIFYVSAYLLKIVFNIKLSTVAAERIGDLAASCDLYIRKNIITPNRFSVCFIVEPSCNKTLLKMLKKHIFIVQSKLGKILINKSKKKLIQKNLFLSVREDHFAYKEYAITSPQLSLDSNQIQRGFSQIKQFGISEKDWWICFHVRDGEYLKNLYYKRDLSYHNYRDFSEESLHDGIKEVTKRGGFAILWSDKNKNTNFVNNSRVLQYNKNTFKSDFLDIFLSSEAKFFIGNTSGITSVPKILGTPVGVCNQIGFNFLLNQKNSLTIYKKLFCVKSKKFLTYNNLLERGLFDKIKGWELQHTSYLTNQNLRAVENDSKEILGLVKDMFNIIDTKNKIKYNHHQQIQFKKNFYSKHKDINLGGNIAPSFLKLNRDLFTDL